MATLALLEHAAAADRTDEGSKAKNLLQEMQTSQSVKFLHFMMDYLELIKSTFEKFQKNHLIIEVAELIDSLTGELELMKEEPGRHSAEFYGKLSEDGDELNNGHPMSLTLKAPTLKIRKSRVSSSVQSPTLKTDSLSSKKNPEKFQHLQFEALTKG